MIKIWPNKVLVETISNETINKIFTKINNYEITLYLLNNQVWTKIKTIPLDEYINHIDCLNNSYYPNAYATLCCVGVCCNSPYWEERGWKNDLFRAIQGAYWVHLFRIL